MKKNLCDLLLALQEKCVLLINQHYKRSRARGYRISGALKNSPWLLFPLSLFRAPTLRSKFGYQEQPPQSHPLDLGSFLLQRPSIFTNFQNSSSPFLMLHFYNSFFLWLKNKDLSSNKKKLWCNKLFKSFLKSFKNKVLKYFFTELKNWVKIKK